MAFDRASGKKIWESTAYKGVPREKRHIKATYANATPATDGRVIVAFFGSQGLYAFDMSGKELWKRDLGVLNVGAYDLPEYYLTRAERAIHRLRIFIRRSRIAGGTNDHDGRCSGGVDHRLLGRWLDCGFCTRPTKAGSPTRSCTGLNSRTRRVHR